MREFFKGWRRKVGCILLGIACAVAAIWVRSLTITDVFTKGNDDAEHEVVSTEGDITWARMPYNGKFGWSWRSEPVRLPTRSPPPITLNWKLNFIGFQFRSYFVETTFERIPVEEAVLPFWAFVLLPTTVSAYLLLWKPRKLTEPDYA